MINNSKTLNAVFNALLVSLILACLIPFWLLIVGSLTSEESLVQNGYSMFPKEFSFAAYDYLWQAKDSIFRAYGMSILISAIGVSYLLQNTATYVTGGQPMTYPAIQLLTRTVNIVGTPTKLVVIITPFLVLILIVLLTQLINHTKVGMSMRAVSKDFETSRLMGIKINKVISTTFIIGSALAVVGSILYFTTYPAITPTAGSMPGLKSFVAAVFGGIGSIPGAMLGGILLGIVECISYKITAIAPYTDAIEFSVLIIILLVRPTGFLGKKRREKV